jgi:sialidase-1
MASLAAHPSKPGLLLFSCPRSLPRNSGTAQLPKSEVARGKREKLSIQLSHDDGKTWPAIKTLDAGPSAYSDLAILPDGGILCLHEAGSSISCARFNLEWITAP